jgi:hypothetical protein
MMDSVEPLHNAMPDWDSNDMSDQSMFHFRLFMFVICYKTPWGKVADSQFQMRDASWPPKNTNAEF